MAALVGKWSYVSQENLDSYMEAIGVNEQMRALAQESKPELEITQDGDTFVITTTVSDKVKEAKFKLGEEFDSVSLTGQPMKSIVTMEGDKMVEKQKIGDGEITVVRTIKDGHLVSTMTAKDASASVTFKKA